MKNLLYFALAVTVLLSGCGNIKQGRAAADAQVVTFHQKFNVQDYRAIVLGADPQMFANASRSGLGELLSVIHLKLGNAVSSQNTNWNVRSFNADTTTVLTQDTKFEKGAGTETFVFRIANGNARLLSYSINSRDLIMK